MSSHHIVREKQEPALLIMQLENFSQENLGQLLEWSPTVIVNAPVYQQAEALGIKIDAVISRESKFNRQHHTRIILTENSALEDGLKFLVGEQYQAVNVITNNFKLKDYLFFAEHINLAVYTPEKKIFSVKSGFSKWQARNQGIEILQEVDELQTSGLKTLGPNRYVTQKDGFYSLSFSRHPFIFIAESL